MMSQPRVSLIAEKMSRELCITKACPTVLRSSELSWLAGILIRALWHRENWTTHCQKMLVATDTYLVERTPATSRFLSLAGTSQWILWHTLNSIVSDWESVFIAKFWFLLYHFCLRAHHICLLWGHWIKISWLYVEKTFSTGLTANPLLPDLWVYVYGIDYHSI